MFERFVATAGGRANIFGWNSSLREVVEWADDDVADLRVYRISDGSVDNVMRLDTPVQSIGLSRKASNLLRGMGCCKVSDILDKTEVDLLKEPSFGKKTVGEVKSKLNEYGYSLKRFGA